MRSVLKKKGQVGNLAPAIISLVFASVILIAGLIMLQEVRDADIVDNCPENNGSNPQSVCEAYDAANASVVGTATFADFWEIIVLAIVITVVIGLLLTVFGRRRR